MVVIATYCVTLINNPIQDLLNNNRNEEKLHRQKYLHELTCTLEKAQIYLVERLWTRLGWRIIHYKDKWWKKKHNKIEQWHRCRYDMLRINYKLINKMQNHRKYPPAKKIWWIFPTFSWNVNPSPPFLKPQTPLL